MDFCILLERRSGEDYSATAWSTEQEAREQAEVFLCQFLPFTMQTATLEEMEQYCWENDLAYIQLSFHRLPTGNNQ